MYLTPHSGTPRQKGTEAVGCKPPQSQALGKRGQLGWLLCAAKPSLPWATSKPSPSKGLNHSPC